jgi:hypothetical protein
VFVKRKAEKAVKAYEQALSQWQAQRDGYTELLDVALGSSGSDSNEIMLGAGEAVFYTVTEVSLVEERRGAGHWEGRSTASRSRSGALADARCVIRRNVTSGLSPASSS